MVCELLCCGKMRIYKETWKLDILKRFSNYGFSVMCYVTSTLRHWIWGRSAVHSQQTLKVAVITYIFISFVLHSPWVLTWVRSVWGQDLCFYIILVVFWSLIKTSLARLVIKMSGSGKCFKLKTFKWVCRTHIRSFISQ